MTDSFSASHKTALMIVDIPSKLLSALGSVLIVQHTLRCMLGEIRTTSYHRFLLGLSLYDVFSSITMLIEPFLPEKDTAGSPACTATGFLKVCAVCSSVMYNVSLSVYFLLIVRYHIREQVLATYFEPICHLFVVVVMGAVFATGIALEVYNPLFAGSCWATDYPEGCTSESHASNSCTRGLVAGYVYARGIHVYYALVFVSMVISNFMIYWTVRQTEKRTRRHSRRFSSTLRRDCWRQTRLAATQSLLFCGAFFITYTPSLILQLIPTSTEWWYYMTLIIAGLTFPLQGFFDFLIYFRRRYIQWRSKASPMHGHLFVIKQTLLSMESPTSSSIRFALRQMDDELERASSRRPRENDSSSNQKEVVNEVDGIEIWERHSEDEDNAGNTSTDSKLGSIYLEEGAVGPAIPDSTDVPHRGLSIS